ncbi:MAG TPA: bestrophin family ion channel [Ohtaekwangia sp.]|nr:bestrophin family ion channel [Ohtaekwangia sp.]
MITYNPKTWLALIFHSYSKHVLKTLLPALGFMAIFTFLVCYLILDYFHFRPEEFRGTTTVHSLLGIVLGLFLVFRTNTAYERWWEGRRMWGALVNSTRNMALKLDAYLSREDHEERDYFAKMIANFVFAVKESLRRGVQLSEMEEVDAAFTAWLKEAKHKPNRISSALYRRVNQLYRDNKITGDQLINLDKELKDLIDFMGVCERIKSTPIPYSYSMFIKKFIFIYIVTLPFGFVTTFGYFTIATVLLVSFVLLSVELIGEEIEDPFGRDVNDLPTDELSVKIRENVREILCS